jgi:hypothetical protein
VKKQSRLFLVATMLIALASPLSQVKAQNAQNDPPKMTIYNDDVKPPKIEPRRELSDEDISMREISVYPNPASDGFYVDFGHNIEANRRIDIYDLLGNHISGKVIDESETYIPIKQLKPGIYILVTGNQSFKVQKI